jgi:hypothetical protein
VCNGRRTALAQVVRVVLCQSGRSVERFRLVAVQVCACNHLREDSE